MRFMRAVRSEFNGQRKIYKAAGNEAVCAEMAALSKMAWDGLKELKNIQRVAAKLPASEPQPIPAEKQQPALPTEQRADSPAWPEGWRDLKQICAPAKPKTKLQKVKDWAWRHPFCALDAVVGVAILFNVAAHSVVNIYEKIHSHKAAFSSEQTTKRPPAIPAWLDRFVPKL